MVANEWNSYRSDGARLNWRTRTAVTITMCQFCKTRNGNTASSGCIVLIGVGANLPAPDGSRALETCRRAVAMLDMFPGLRLGGLSRWFGSAPVPPSGQPPYVNAVASLLIEPGAIVDPADLLARLMVVEEACGRQRSVANAARTLDLDIIAIGNLVRAQPDPVLPHPRAHLRAFVLAPLADVAPCWVHPVLGRTPAALLAELPEQDMWPLSIGPPVAGRGSCDVSPADAASPRCAPAGSPASVRAPCRARRSLVR
jgi:2-amino-4-hydroxy-6-hydroxymethyldihydropteridine diphosphokinase